MSNATQTQTNVNTIASLTATIAFVVTVIWGVGQVGARVGMMETTLDNTCKQLADVTQTLKQHSDIASDRDKELRERILIIEHRIKETKAWGG